MRGLSICSGIGGLDLAAEQADIEVIGQIEIDDFCTLVLEKHWPTVPRWRDLKTFHGTECGRFDIIFGGIPCQPFSAAGPRRGIADDRHLWPDMLRIIRTGRPNWVVIENVAHFARMALDIVWADLEDENYEVGAYILPACAVEAPHQRQRIFVVAHAKRERCDRLTHVAGRHDDHWQETEWQESASGIAQSGENYPANHVADAARYAREYQQGQWQGVRNESAIYGAQGDDWHARVSQPFLGRDLDGIPDWLDGHWPATPDKPQHVWEPSRTVTVRPSNWGARIKALGNAVVPVQAAPVFRAIMAIEKHMYGPSADC